MFQLKDCGVKSTLLIGKKFMMNILGAGVSPPLSQRIGLAHSQRQEQHREDVDRHPELPQAPSARQERLLLYSFDDDAADGNDVRADQCAGAQGCDDVQCHRAAKVDERQHHREYITE